MADQSAILSGGCLCGAVAFTCSGPLGGPLGQVTACHCAMCRRAQGYAAAAAPVAAAGFEVVRGRAEVREYESSPGKRRAFCRACGSPLYSRRDDTPSTLRLRLGALDATPKDLRIDAHIFSQDAPAWSLPAQAPAYAGKEPGRA